MTAADLRRRRREAGLTQAELAELAERIGRHQSAVSEIEGGTRSVTLSQAARWLRACGYELVLRRVDNDCDDRTLVHFDGLGDCDGQGDDFRAVDDCNGEAA